MAFKLTKDEAARKTHIMEALAEARAEIEAAGDRYNEVLEQARAFAQEVAEDRRADWDLKSERWQEGDKGQAADAWISEWENFDSEEAAEPDMDGAADLDNLPDCAED
jgi:hypothetical protein